MKKTSLTEDQSQALKKFISWLRDDKTSKHFVLSGHAGSGKTFLSIEFLKLIEKEKLCWTVVAPTHKAVGVLRKALDDEKLKPTWYPSTIHRLLRLKIKRKGSLEICESTEQTEKSLEQLGLVLIDEASMVDTNLLEIALNCAQLNKTRLIFVGDPAQLPPVGENISPVFSMKQSTTFHLIQVVRHQGPVLSLASLFRKEEFPCTPPPCFHVLETDKGVIGALDHKNWLHQAKSSLRKAADNDDPDQARILCYTNKLIDKLVPHARRAIHGDMADHMSVLPGEVLISRKAVMASASIDGSDSFEEPGILFGSNTEMIVKDVRPEIFDFDLDIPAIEAFIAEVQCGNREFSIRLLPEVGSKSRDILDRFLQKLSFQAKELSGEDARSCWRNFFGLRDSFASVGPASVLTVHRSQGSTFKEVFVAADVFWPSDKIFRKQLTYVAVSRASKGVWLVGSPKEGLKNLLWDDELNLIHQEIRN